MGARLFVGVFPPAQVREQLEAFLAPRQQVESPIRWVLAEAWHVTCAFAADVPDRLVEPARAALDAVADRTDGFTITLAGAGAFPDPDQARALWLGVDQGGDALGRLATRCRNALGGCGVVVAGGKFRAHLTVGRANAISANRWLQVLHTLAPLRWPVEEFALVESRGLPGGAGYRVLARFALNPSANSAG